MSIRNRTATVISGAAIATALAGAAAFAAVDTPPAPAGMAGMPAHMAELDGPAVAKMQSMMNEGASVGEMHRWMTEQGLDIGPDAPRHGPLWDEPRRDAPEHGHRPLTRRGPGAGWRAGHPLNMTHHMGWNGTAASAEPPVSGTPELVVEAGDLWFDLARIDIAAGTPTICSVPGHASGGMRGQLVVTAARARRPLES